MKTIDRIHDIELPKSIDFEILKAYKNINMDNIPKHFKPKKNYSCYITIETNSLKAIEKALESLSKIHFT